MGLLEKFRRWIDADYIEEEGTGSLLRNKSEEFLVNVARKIEETMREEMFTPPGGPTYLPREYIVFLSPDDDAEWRGEKRRGLEQGLYHVLSEQAALLQGEHGLQTRSLTIEIRMDGALEKGQFRVQAVWDTETEQTLIRPRKIKGAEKGTEDEETIVRPRSLFSVMVKQAGENDPKTFSFSKSLITIGRGSRKTNVDLPLEGDLEISRHQAALEFKDGQFKLTCVGRNPILVDGVELQEGA